MRPFARSNDVLTPAPSSCGPGWWFALSVLLLLWISSSAFADEVKKLRWGYRAGTIYRYDCKILQPKYTNHQFVLDLVVEESSSEGFVIRYIPRYHEDPNRVERAGLPRIPAPLVLEMDSLGKIQPQKSVKPKVPDGPFIEPFIKDPHGALFLELPASPSNRWNVTRQSKFSYGRKFDPAVFNMGARELAQLDRSTPYAPAVEKFGFHIDGRTEGFLKIVADYDIDPATSSNGEAKLSAKCRLEYLFGQRDGIVHRFSMDADYKIEDPNGYRTDHFTAVFAFRKILTPGNAQEFSLRPKQELPAMPEPATERALALLKSTEAADRRSAVLSFFRYGPNSKRSDVVTALESAFDQLDSAEKFWAVAAMAAWGKEKTPPLLEKYLSHPDKAARNAAIEGLGNYPNPAAISLISKQLGDPEAVLHIANAVRKLGPAAVRSIKAQFSHKDPIIRANACAVLAKIGNPEDLSDLNELANDPDPDVVSAARSAFKQIKKRHPEKLSN